MTFGPKLPLLALCAFTVQAATWIVPGAGNDNGFATRLTVTNRGGSATSVTFRFLPLDPSIVALAETRAVDPRQTLVLGDALAELWKLTGTTGAIRIDADQPLSIHARRLQGDGARLAGSRLPVLAEGSLLSQGQAGYLLWASSTGATSARLLLTFLDPATHVVAILNDANGAKLGTQDITGDAGSLSVPLSAFADGDIGPARLSVVVSSGRAVAALETRDASSSDLAVSEAVNSQELVTNGTFGDDLRRPASGSQTLVTDLRLANIGLNKMTVPLSSLAGTRVLTLLPGQMVEILDHLGAYLGAYPNPTDVGSASIIGGVGRPDLVMQARLRVVNNDGSPGAWSEVHNSQPYGNGYAAGQTAIVDGLPPAGARVGLVLRSITASTPVQVHVQGYRPDGSPSGDAVDIDLKNNEVRFVELASVPALAGLAERDSVFVTVNTGTADVRAFQFRPGTNDPEVWAATAALNADELANFTACTPPTLTSLKVDKLALAEPGQVLIEWQSSDTLTVDLAPWATGLPANGSFQADVAATMDATVTAHNACAQQDTPLHLTVGAPVLTAASGPNTTSGAPGQIMRLALDNIADPAQVTDVLFQSPDGHVYPAAVLGQAQDGLFEARIPLIMSNADTNGYRSGPMKVSALVNGATTGALDFSIDPLVYSGDAAADFNQLLDKFDTAMQAAAAQLQTLDYTAPALTGQQANYTRILNRLRTLAASIASTGQGTLLLDASAKPAAGSITLSAADLATMLAYNNNLRPAAAADAPAARAAVDPLRGARTCIADKVQLIPICKAIEKFEYEDAQLTQQLDNFADWFDLDPLDKWAGSKTVDEIKGAEDKLKSMPGNGKLGGIAKVLWQIMQIQRVQCDLYAIRVKQFIVTPKELNWVKSPGRVPDTPLTVTVLMEPEKTTKQFVDDIIGKGEAKLQDKLKKKQFAAWAAAQLARFLEDQIRADLTAMIDGMKDFLKTDQFKAQTVGACDLKQVWGKTNGRPIAGNEADTPKSIIARTGRSPQGEDNYYYVGRKPRQRETMCIQPKFDNFLFHHDIEQKGKEYVEKVECKFTALSPVVTKFGRAASTTPAPTAPEPVFSDEVNTGHGPRRFTVFGAQSDTFQNNGGPEQRIVDSLPSGQEVTTGKPYSGPSTSAGVSSSSVNGRQTEDTPTSQTWEMTVSATGSGSGSQESPPWEDRTSAGFSITAENNPQRGLSPRATIDITQNGNCGSFTYSVSIITPDGKGVSLAFGPKSIMDDFHADVEATQVNVGMTAEAFDLLDRGPESTCKPKLRLRLYDAETDNSGPVVSSRVAVR